MTTVEDLLKSGPARSGVLAQALVRAGSSPAAARKQIQRAGSPVERLSVRLPRNERLLFLPDHRKAPDFLADILRLLDEAKSGLAVGVHSLAGAGGLAHEAVFAARTGCPVRQTRHVSAAEAIQHLIGLGFIEQRTLGNGWSCVAATTRSGLPIKSEARLVAEDIAEKVVLASLANWASQLTLVSHDSIRLRDLNASLPMVGSFEWDFTAPCYLAALVDKGPKGAKPGFLVADVMLGRELSRSQVQFALQKGATTAATAAARPLIQLLVADHFAAEAFNAGKAAGLLMVTVANLLGAEIADAISGLITTLTDAASAMAASPDKVYSTFDTLAKIEGAAGQLRGPLLELIAFHATSILEAGTTELGVSATSTRDGRKADIDVLCHVGTKTALAIECKGRAKHLAVDEAVVNDWLTRQIPVFDAFLREKHQTERRSYELWTTGSFTPEALLLLQTQAARTKKYSIGYKAGPEVMAYVERTGTSRARQMLIDHFLGAPF